MKTAAKLSRSGRTNPLGKCVEQIGFKVDTVSAEEYRSNAASVDIPASEYVRICMALFHGHRAELLASYEALLDAIEGVDKEKYLSRKHHRPLAVTKKTETKISHLRRAA